MDQAQSARGVRSRWLKRVHHATMCLLVCSPAACVVRVRLPRQSCKYHLQIFAAFEHASLRRGVPAEIKIIRLCGTSTRSSR